MLGTGTLLGTGLLWVKHGEEVRTDLSMADRERLALLAPVKIDAFIAAAIINYTLASRLGGVRPVDRLHDSLEEI